MKTKQFIGELSKYCPDATPAFWDALTAVLQEEVRHRKQVLSGSGEIAGKLWFIRQGFALQYLLKDGKKIPYHFWDQGDFMVDICSFFLQMPSPGTIELQEDSILLSITYDQLYTLSQRFPETERLINAIVTANTDRVQKETRWMLTLTERERYQQLLKSYPAIMQKTALKYTTAYLGISMRTLERIQHRKK